MTIPSHLRCDQVVEIVSDYLERALASRDVEELEQHLLICNACADYVEQMREVLDKARKLPGGEAEPLDETTAAQLLATFRRWKGR